MTFELLIRLNLLFLALFIVGTLLSLHLYHWNYGKFFRSTLWLKISFWIPIYLVIILLLYFGQMLALALVVLVSLLAIKETVSQLRITVPGILYLLVFIVMFAHLLIVYNNPKPVIILVVVSFSSVLSDIHAYFFGSFFGSHKLPTFINPSKSWEGVVGQVIGGVVGYLLVAWATGLVLPSWPLALVIGLASAAGDILNSIIKRTMSIKDWGNTIPGHGGVLDRFASLSFALAATVWYMNIVT